MFSLPTQLAVLPTGPPNGPSDPPPPPPVAPALNMIPSVKIKGINKIEFNLYISPLYVCMAKKYINLYFVDTPRISIIAKLSIRKPARIFISVNFEVAP